MLVKGLSEAFRMPFKKYLKGLSKAFSVLSQAKVAPEVAGVAAAAGEAETGEAGEPGGRSSHSCRPDDGMLRW